MKDIKAVAQTALDSLIKAGADKAMCVVRKGLVKEITVDGGEINLMRSLFNNSIALKAIKDGKKGVMSINKLDDAAIEEAARQCVEAAEASVYDEAVTISPLTENAEFKTGIDAPDEKKLFERLCEYISDIGRDYPKIILEQVIVDFSYVESCLANTNGVCYTHDTGSYSLGTMFSAHDGEKATSFNNCGVEFTSLEKPLIDYGMQRRLYEFSVKELEAKAYEGKFTGKVVFAPVCLGDMLSMALGNFISDSTIIDGTSPWKNALGTKVASDCLTVSSIPLDSRMVGSERFHDDGYISQNFDYIKNGVLESFDLSEYAANKTGGQRALNSSSCMGVTPGEESLESIIGNIELGILVCRFSGGSPATNGDFSGVAKNSFLIENGKIAGALSETMISGNLAKMLRNVTAISKETVCDGGSVLPWVVFDGITVSGK